MPKYEAAEVNEGTRIVRLRMILAETLCTCSAAAYMGGLQDACVEERNGPVLSFHIQAVGEGSLWWV